MENMAYEAFNIILIQTDADLSAAQAQGLASGMLCVNAQTASSCWLTELLGNAGPMSTENEALLLRLFEGARQALAANDFEFNLFLPDEDILLSTRVIALKEWCQGFLWGVGSVHSTQLHDSEHMREILKDITEFTKLDTVAEGEEDENAFMEVTEYLKSAVLLLRDELNSSTNDTFH
jgi:uncharacterized protein YgfB (UPF0149 family)